ESSLIWRNLERRRLPARPCDASISCSRSSAPSTAKRQNSGLRYVERSPRRSLLISISGCASSGPCSSGNDTAKAINYLLNRRAAFTRFLDDGRICLSNNAAERALRGVAVGRRNWTFAGSDAGGHRAAAIYTLIETCKMNDVDPQAWLADVLARLPDYPVN